MDDIEKFRNALNFVEYHPVFGLGQGLEPSPELAWVPCKDVLLSRIEKVDVETRVDEALAEERGLSRSSRAEEEEAVSGGCLQTSAEHGPEVYAESGACSMAS
jgi:hypothetical protein